MTDAVTSAPAGGAGRALRVVVADDSLLFREGLVRLLADAGHVVVAAVGDADALLAVVDARAAEVDVAVVDVRMPPDMASDGARAAATLRRRHPSVGVLLLSQHVEVRHSLDLVGTPGFGHLLKDRVLHLDEFDDALRRVAAGGSALDPEVVRALVGPRSRTGSGALRALSDRELEVLGLVAEGRSNTAVAARLHLSARTVEAHLRSVFAKLDLPDDGTSHRRVLAVVAHLRSSGR